MSRRPRVMWLLVLAVFAARYACGAAAQCNAGETGPDGGPCTPCPAGTYKVDTGSANCTRCGLGGMSPAASTAEASCFCGAGYTGLYRTSYSLRVLAGSGEIGLTDGSGTQAEITAPRGVAFAPDATALAVSSGDEALPGANYSGVRVINMASGDVRTLAGGRSAGFQDGLGTAARFMHPAAVAYSPDGTRIAVADELNHAVRVVHVASQNVTTLAGTGEATASGAVADGHANDAGSPPPTFRRPLGIAWSPLGGILAVSEYEAHRIRLISTDGNTTTLAGGGSTLFPQSGYQDGVGTEARFYFPVMLTFSPDGATIAVADRLNFAIRLVDVSSGLTTTLAGGNKTLGQSVVQYPHGVAFSPDGASVVFSENNGQRVQQVIVSTGETIEIVKRSQTNSSNLFGIAWSPRGPMWAFVAHKRHKVFILDGPGCSRCEIGKYKSTNGNATCVDCPMGKYHSSMHGQ